MSIFKKRIQNSGNVGTMKIVEPADLFKSLIHQEGYDYLRDIQKEFLQKWHAKRDQKDVVGILNTGAGKTLIGQLMLLSKLHEGEGPAVYLCPDKQLVDQAIEQARIHNIPVVSIPQTTSQPAEFPLDFTNGKAILITTFERMFNGKSIFGVEGYGSRPVQEIGSLVIDDAHSCIKKARQQCTIEINKNNEAYQKIFDLFVHDLKEQGEGAVTAIKKGESSVARLVPFWAWRKQKENVMAILQSLYHEDDLSVKYSWGLIGDLIQKSQCYISGSKIEITPLQLPFKKIPSFYNAKNRYILSATFNNNTDLITELGIDKSSIENPIEAENQGDAGERLIVAPKRYFQDLSDETMRPFIAEYAKNNNVVVLVPNSKKADEWSKYNPTLVNKDNILEATRKLKETQGNLMVFLNRYDGMDLPGDACRVLVLDGLPNVQSVREKYISIVREGSPFVNAQIAQTIEQGLGRAVRSGSDYCTVFILDNSLLNFIGIDKNREFFSATTKKQLDFGLELFSEDAPSDVQHAIKEISEATEACLARDPDWRKYHKEMILGTSSRKANSNNPLLEIAEIEHTALKLYNDDYSNEACSTLRKMIGDHEGILNTKDQAWYLQIGGKILDSINPTGAIDMQIRAKTLSPTMLKPPIHAYSKLTKTQGKQADSIIRWLKQFSNATDVAIAVENLHTNLIYSPESDSLNFEKDIFKIGAFLGFGSQMPDEHEGDGPDNLWRLESGINLLIEAKNNSINNKISRTEISQLLHSIEWHKDKYGTEQKFTPILMHKSSKTFDNAHFYERTKVMDQNSLLAFKNAISQFGKYLGQKPPHTWTEPEVQNLLEELHLTYVKIVGKYTVPLR